MEKSKSYLKNFIFSYNFFYSNKNRYIYYIVLTSILCVFLIIAFYFSSYIKISEIDKTLFLQILSSIATFLGLCFAALSLVSNSIENRNKNSIDIMFSIQKDLEFQKRKSLLLRRNEHNFSLKCKKEDMDKLFHDEYELFRSSFFYCLDMYEFIGLSIKKGIVDEDIFIEMYLPDFIKIWEKMQESIEYIREENPKYLENVEWLAKKYLD